MHRRIRNSSRIEPPKLSLFDCTFEQAMDVVCNHALRHSEPGPEPVGRYIFSNQKDLVLFALEFRGRLRMADNAALVYPAERAFIVDYDICERVQCFDLCGMWLWDTG